MTEYGQIVKSNLYEQIANKIEAQILNNNLKLGDKLPSEFSLAEQFGVSRNILREAIKTLKERGLIDVRVGSGIFVSEPKTNILKNTLSRLMVLKNISLRDLFELRLIIEVKAAGLAAERIDRKDLEKLEEFSRKMKNNIDNVEQWKKSELRFHLIIAKATGNPLIYSFLDPISNLLEEFFAKGHHKLRAKKEGIEGHTKIIKAIKSKNVENAQFAMKNHLMNSKNIHKIDLEVRD